MRIISGKYKGRSLNGFNIDGTRPTMDRVKESVFAMIQQKIDGSTCLDLFAGSGSLGFEALSLGAKACTFVDHNSKVISVLRQNKEKLKIEEETEFLQMDYEQALQFLFKQQKKYDLIFLDPPYDKNFIQPALTKILAYDLLKEDGRIICEYEHEIFDIDLVCIKEKRYGDKWIRIYKK